MHRVKQILMTKTVNKEPISVARESGPGGLHSDNPPSPHPHTNAQFDSAVLKEKIKTSSSFGPEDDLLVSAVPKIIMRET